MRAYLAGMAIAVLLAALGWRSGRARRVEAAAEPLQTVSSGELSATAMGHEFRQDDWPAIAAAPDGTLWVAWLSFAGDRDDVAIRHGRDGRWGTLQWVPGTSGDSWMPQVAVDARNGVWVVWSQQAGGNWDLYARRFDPEKQEWSGLMRLTSDPGPDIHPRLVSDGKGRFALVWQAFRSGWSNIYLKSFDGERWSEEKRVTNRAADDWEPAAAFDSKGTIWVAYDSYKNGNFDVLVTPVPGQEMAVAATAAFEARATIAVDSGDRVWVAWEEGEPNWGKDQGYVLRGRAPGVPLGGARRPRIRCWESLKWNEPESPLAGVFKAGPQTYQPNVFSDGRGSVWVAAKTRGGQPRPGEPPRQGYWEYFVTHYDGRRWSDAFALPSSKGRSSTRMNAALAPDGALGALWTVWPSDERQEPQYHRPRRQRIYAAPLPAPSPTVGAMAWRTTPSEAVDARLAHPDEPGDLRAIRAYTTTVNGKTMHIVRGDFHRHTELSWDGGGFADGNLQDYYRYMIDVASMDFGASTDHQGGAWPYWWWYTQKMTDMYHAPGKYVPIFGYERSTVYPYGHRNVFFARRSASRVTPFHLRQDVKNFGFPPGPQGDEPPVGTGELASNDTKLLYEEIRPRQGIAISHTSATRMGTDWRDNDPELEPVVEIFQGCRTNYEQLGAPLAADETRDAQHVKQAGYQPAGFVSNAWGKGYKLGIITSSDHGSTHISYAMVYTDNPTREGILEAIRKRHTYGAMDNIIVEAWMGRHFMGDEFAAAGAEPIRVKLRGTRPIARVDIIKDSQVIYSTEPRLQQADFEFTDKGNVSGRHYYYVRAQQEDGTLAWSSPFFVNYK